MKIAIIGAGAIGSVIAACLTKAGQEICLIGRQDQVSAIENNGLTVKGVRQLPNIKLKALTRLDQQYDLVIFTVKTQDIEDAYRANRQNLDGGMVLTTQNGVQADNILSGHFDRDRMMSSIVMFGATFVQPSEVTMNFEGDWILGKPFGPNDPMVSQVAEILRKTFNIVVVNDIMGMKWVKLFVNFNNCIPALIGKSMHETFSDLDFCRLSVLLLKEGIGIVEKAGIQMVSLPQFPKERITGLASMPVDQGAQIINKTLTGLSKEPLLGSILQSIMRKRTSEIDFINGEVAQMASHYKLPAPLNRRVVDMVHEVETTGEFFKPSDVKAKFNLG